MSGGGGDDEGQQHVLEWEVGLPDGEDVTPLSFSLVPPGILTAFGITPEPTRTMLDVNRASQNTLSTLRRHSAAAGKPFSSFSGGDVEDPMVFEVEDNNNVGEPSRKVLRRLESSADSPAATAATASEDQSEKMAKRGRLVWTPQLHRRFIDVVGHLGTKNAVPKTIMQLMNVEGLTRENVASHLQKYRLYLKRMPGIPGEPSSSSDHLVAASPVVQNLHEQSPASGQPVQMHMPYMPTMMPMPMFGMPVNAPPNVGPYQSAYWPLGEQQRDWSGRNMFG